MPPQEIELPGGKKIPGWVLLAGGAVVVVILLLKKSPDEETAQGDLLASELDQRLQEMQEGLQAALDAASMQPATDETAPPAQPVDVTPTESIPVYPSKGTPGGLIGLSYVAPGAAPVPSMAAPFVSTSEISLETVLTGLPSKQIGAPVGTEKAEKTRKKFLGIPTKQIGAPVGTEKAAQTRISLIEGAKPETVLKITKKEISKGKEKREETSQALKKSEKTIVKQAPSTSQKLKSAPKKITKRLKRKR